MSDFNVTEKWKPVPGFESFYSVSNAGRVRNERNGYILRPTVRKTGYAFVSLCATKVKKPISVHRLVMLAFVGHIPEKYVTNHKNGIKNDNRLDNLEYCTPTENNIHAIRVLGRRSGCCFNWKPNSRCKITAEDGKEIRRLRREGVSVAELAAQYGVVVNHISKVLSFRRKLDRKATA